MSGLSQVALFHQLACMVILCCLLKRKVGEIFAYVSAIVLINANTVTDALPIAACHG